MGNPIDEVIGNQLKKIREGRNISVDVLAKHLNVSEDEISKYENGESRISASRLFEASRFFDMPVSEFFDGLHDD